MKSHRIGCLTILLLSSALAACTGGRAGRSEYTQISGPRPTFHIVGSDGIVEQAGAEMLRVPMEAPRTVDGGDTVEDAAVLVGGSLVVLRGLRRPMWAGSPVDSVDVYRLDGMRRTYDGKNMGPYARGRAYTSPDHSWGIILPTDDGVLYGYSVVNADAWMTKREVTEVLTLAPGLSKPKATFSHDGSLVLAGWKDGSGRDAILIVNAYGHEVQTVEPSFAELIP